jgi:hypothetical protein
MPQIPCDETRTTLGQVHTGCCERGTRAVYSFRT